MSKVQMLRASVTQRLTAAAEEIFVLFERSIAEYEEELSRSKEENERQRKLLDAVFNPQLQLHRAGVQQLLESKEEVPPEQQELSSSLDQEDPEPPHIKEEQEELWTSQEGEQLQGPEDADITKIPSTPVPVKSEDDEEKPQSSQLHQRQTEEMEREADGEDCGGSEPAGNSHPDRHLQPDTMKTSHSSESETEDSDGDTWKDTREPQSDLNILNNSGVILNDMGCNIETKSYSCSECGKIFGQKGTLQRHMRCHTGLNTCSGGSAFLKYIPASSPTCSI
ncbi:zinc finger and BTB domain-containing protein 17-like isoform X3 [Thunnus albacares]|uniref:zinc finger and BTB domain-containing protein 17-like isoform X3 n=1 Tax=Thunnus albacares TaxID=8236 RepID=UPI001CF60F19|nr:zinc finger and BTB domain-containing protein 17-like isoform X3 [Thunnus albacares]